ncbi:MAG: ABC transporter substrate binding protein [Thermodesulfobacteriota bacterium]
MRATSLPFPILLLAVLLSTGGCSESPAPASYRVGIISPGPQFEELISGFRRGLEQQLRQEGAQVTFLYDGQLEDTDEFDLAFRSLLERRIDLLLVLTSGLADRAAAATADSGLPVVAVPLLPSAPAVEVHSPARPAANVTGIQIAGGMDRGLGLFCALKPGMKRLFVPIAGPERRSGIQLADLATAASSLGVALLPAPVASVQELQAALAGMPADVDGVWLMSSILLVANADLIVQAATARRLPVAANAVPLDKGLVMTYAPGQTAMGEQASRLAARVLRDSPAASLPVETADLYLGVNLQAAAAIGLPVPDEILRQARVVLR